jgi:LysR family hydrogen peroxide-inducible transcriptional activator
MTRNQIQYILTLAKLQNFGKAADACFVTQSTLSAMVAKFEDQIEIQLFDRKTRPISITPRGEKIIQSLQSIYREYQLLDEKINSIKGYEIGNLSIACIPTVATYLYPLILNSISKDYPEINFTIHELTTENIVDQIIAGDIDIGIVSIPLNNKELTEYPLYDEDFLLYDYDNKKKSSKFKVTDIDLDRLWLMEEGHCLRNQVGKICELRQQNKINGNLTYSCGTISTLIEMVKKNKGVTLLPRLAIVDNPQVEEEFIFQLTTPVPARKIGIITHKHYLKRRMLSNLVKTIERVVKINLPKSKKRRSLVEPF